MDSFSWVRPVSLLAAFLTRSRIPSRTHRLLLTAGTCILPRWLQRESAKMPRRSSKGSGSLPRLEGLFVSTVDGTLLVLVDHSVVVGVRVLVGRGGLSLLRKAKGKVSLV